MAKRKRAPRCRHPTHNREFLIQFKNGIAIEWCMKCGASRRTVLKDCNTLKNSRWINPTHAPYRPEGEQ
jgi:hypothetical protein